MADIARRTCFFVCFLAFKTLFAHNGRLQWCIQVAESNKKDIGFYIAASKGKSLPSALRQTSLTKLYVELVHMTFVL